MISRSVVIGTTGCSGLAPIPLARGMLGGLKASSLPIGQPFSLGSHHLPGRQPDKKRVVVGTTNKAKSPNPLLITMRNLSFCGR